MGDSVYVSFKIVNMGNLTVNEIPILLKINGSITLSDTLYQNMEPGDYIQYSFAKPFIVPFVSDIQPYYMVKIETVLPCDAQKSNNVVEIMACVDVVKVVDLKVKSIDTPLESPCDTGLTNIKVKVTLSNEGNVEIAACELHAEVINAGQIHASFTETTGKISAQSTLEYEFTQPYSVPNIGGTYQVKVFFDNIADDANVMNDTMLINPCAIQNVDVPEMLSYNWTMGQNIPNPVMSNTKIPYTIPQDGMIRFSVVTITGQVLYTKELPTLAGTHFVEFDTRTLANGIYYYSMEYQGKRLVKKMTIQK